MSFELYLQAFQAGESKSIPASLVLTAFGGAMTVVSANEWRLFFDDENHCHVFVSPTDDEGVLIDAITIERPCHDARLWAGLASLLHQDSFVLYFLGSKALVSDEIIASQLPEGMVDSLGGFVVVNTSEQILNELSSA